MYNLKWHDELEVGNTMSASFSKMNIETDELTLYSEDKVPSDCDILLINGATKDISKEEKNKIILDFFVRESFLQFFLNTI